MRRSLSIFGLLSILTLVHAQTETSVIPAAKLTPAVNDPVIMTIAGKEIPKSEFEYIYNKNNSVASEQTKNLQEYTDMFINFKLKVAEAEARGYAQTPEFINELEGYRKQLAAPYLIDKSEDDRLARQAYERLNKHIEASHILIGLGNGSPADTLKAYQKALSVRERLLKGEDFAQVARETSEDPSAHHNGGYLGFFKGFMMVFPFEEAAYSAQMGSITMPVRSQFGYHIIKVTNERPDQGEVRVAHIMIMLPQGATEAEKKSAKERIDAAYQELKGGTAFAEVAKMKSEDQYSASKGGEMPPFEAFRLPAEFESVAFGLTEVGSYSEPFATDFGYHIVQLLGKKAPASLDERMEEITKRLARDERGGKSREVLVAALKKEYGCVVNETACEAIASFCTATPDSIMEKECEKLSSVIMSVGTKEVPQSNFVKYLIRKGERCQGKSSDFFHSQLNKFVEEEMIAYEETQLNRKYPEFRNLMKEYHDGILLFEVSNREVWDKAAKDEKGLEKFFKKNKKKYTFDAPRFKGFVIQCSNDSVLTEIKSMIATLSPDSAVLKVRKAMNDSVTRVKIDRVLVSKGENAMVDQLVFGVVRTTLPDSNMPVMETVGAQITVPENYKDVRGLVTSDYQNEVEKRWIKQLRKKYKVKVNKEVLMQVK